MNSTVPAPAVLRLAAQIDGVGGHAVAHRLRQAGRGAFLDHLLEAALQRAIALEQMDGVAVAVAEHLDFDMARLAG